MEGRVGTGQQSKDKTQIQKIKGGEKMDSEVNYALDKTELFNLSHTYKVLIGVTSIIVQ